MRCLVMTKASHLKNLGQPSRAIDLIIRMASVFHGGGGSRSVPDGFGVLEKRSLDLDTGAVEKSSTRKRAGLRTAWAALGLIPRRWRGTKSRVYSYPMLKGRVYFLAQAVTCCTDYDALLH